MAAEAWDYWVPYQANIEVALQSLRQQVFRSGRFRGSEQKPLTPEEAVESMGADGTASILDIMGLSDQPEIGRVHRLSDEELEMCFGTSRPTREDVEQNMEFFDRIERGQGVYIVVYDAGQPREILFAGYSFD